MRLHQGRLLTRKRGYMRFVTSGTFPSHALPLVALVDVTIGIPGHGRLAWDMINPSGIQLLRYDLWSWDDSWDNLDRIWQVWACILHTSSARSTAGIFRTHSLSDYIRLRYPLCIYIYIYASLIACIAYCWLGCTQSKLLSCCPTCWLPTTLIHLATDVGAS